MKYTYNFKTLAVAAFATLLADYDEPSQEAIKASFDIAADGKAKRKPVEVELTMPEFYDHLPSVLAKTAISRVVADFVKAVYIDNFAEVGNHSWDYIESELAKGRGAVVEVSDDQWNLAASTIAAFIAATGRNAKLVPALSAILTGKFTIGSIRKNMGRDDIETIQKLETVFTDWAAWESENDADNLEDITTVFTAIGKKLDKMLKREESAPLADLL